MPTCEYGFVVHAPCRSSHAPSADSHRFRAATGTGPIRVLRAPTQVSAVCRTSMFRSAGSRDIRNGTLSWPRFCEGSCQSWAEISRSRAQTARTIRRWSFRSSTPGVPSGFSFADPSRLCQSSTWWGSSPAPTGSVACDQRPSALGEMTRRNGASIDVSPSVGRRLNVARGRGLSPGSATRPPAPKIGCAVAVRSPTVSSCTIPSTSCGTARATLTPVCVSSAARARRSSRA